MARGASIASIARRFASNQGQGQPCTQCKKRQVGCPLSEGQTWGQKCKMVRDSDDGWVTGPLMKQERVALPRLGEVAEVEDEWRHRIVDVLEITNVERHTM